MKFFKSTLWICVILFASDAKSSTKYEKEEWRLDYFSVAVGLEYFSSLEKRGATFYDSFQVIPIFSVDLFSENLFLVGTNLFYVHQWSDYVLHRSRLSINATGDSPLYLTGGVQKTDRNERNSTIEFDQVLEFRLPDRGELTLTVSQDLKAHHGTYLEAKLRAVVLNVQAGKLRLQPAVFGWVGAGSGNHNRYLYGSGADAFGLSHTAYGISLSAPPAIDYFFPIIELKRYEIHGAGNRSASLVSGKSSGFKATILFAFELFST